ncbi:HAD family hydrolase [Burkholderia multivorans]|uniref:HAD family hydrolase n=1 Tax=Burkholderia multivorans TaxID=87883 RepID=UPI001E4AB32A|nr:HAD family hydrolase [Burkholderia multivorans]
MKMSNVTTVHRFDAIEAEVENCNTRSVLFHDPYFKERLFEKIDSLAPQGNFVLSFDVFDTLLLRNQKSELRRFIEIGQRMSAFRKKSGLKNTTPRDLDTLINSLSLSDIDAFLARHLGTKASYRAGKKVAGYGEGSLIEIQCTASKILNGSDRLKDDFIEIELSYEAEGLSVNDALLSYATRHKQNGGKVILVSDMYMHAEHIENLLGRLKIDLELFDLIISSADTKISKSSGKIFEEIEKILNEPSDRFIHIGDSIDGDYIKARKAGWRALHLPISTAEMSERISDHALLSEMLEDKFSIRTDIQAPR